MSKRFSGMLIYPQARFEQSPAFHRPTRELSMPSNHPNTVSLSQQEAEAIEAYAKASMQLQNTVETLCKRLSAVVERLEKLEKQRNDARGGKRFS